MLYDNFETGFYLQEKKKNLHGYSTCRTQGLLANLRLALRLQFAQQDTEHRICDAFLSTMQLTKDNFFHLNQKFYNN